MCSAGLSMKKKCIQLGPGLRLCWSHATKSDFLALRPNQHMHGKYIHNASTLTMLYIFMYYTPAQIFIQLTCRIPVVLNIVLSSTVGKSVDPDQQASEKPADLDLLLFQNRISLG